ncbi:MAG: CoA-binding protein [Candidimonas sp.]|nr:MAG: CoA-binding protein [Candidimonas sp.]
MKNEVESKAILRRCGIETTMPVVARTPGEAAAVARAISAPLAMKIVSADIVHKAAAGGVALNVSVENAATAFERIMAACAISNPDAAVEGVLLEGMVASSAPEFFIGARIDQDYGAVVLFGLGGSNVETGEKPAAMLAPLSPVQARDMVARVLARLDEISLEPAACDRLAECLMAVGGPQGLLARGEVVDLDINPLVVVGGRCLALDAVAQLPRGEGLPAWTSDAIQKVTEARKARLAGMKALFQPDAVAFIGASTSREKLGYRNIKNLVDYQYPGKIYPIHPSAAEICGQRAYPSILDVPDPVDRAYIAVGADRVPEMLQQCKRKGVRVVQVLSAGFAEWSAGHSSAGTTRERDVRGALGDTSMRMIGPNCIGTFSASGRLSMGASRYNPTQVPGATFISQSGTFAGDVVRRAQVMNIPVAQVLSCGNCLDLDLTDYLLFCESDENTTLIAFYVESIKRPNEFFRIAAQSRKPIVLFKGGTTAQGMVAASSHTAALATDEMLWEQAVCHSGILQVDSVAGLMDILLVHGAHQTIRGNRLAVFGSGGGVGVTACDLAAKLGLVVPPLAATTAAALNRYGTPGTNIANPIDIPVWGLYDHGRIIIAEIVNQLKEDPGIDSIIVYIEMGTVMDFTDTEADGLRELNAMCKSFAMVSDEGPRVSLVLRSTGEKTQEDFMRQQRADLIGRGISVFTSVDRAVRAHAGLRRLSKHGI